MCLRVQGKSPYTKAIQIIISDPFETVSFWIGAKSKVNANETITWITNGYKINLEMSQTYSL